MIKQITSMFKARKKNKKWNVHFRMKANFFRVIFKINADDFFLFFFLLWLLHRYDNINR